MNAEAWKKHFVDMADGKFREKTFYQLGTQRGAGDVSPIQLVTPTQQAIEMAHAQEKQQRPKRPRRKVKTKTKHRKQYKRKIKRRVQKKTVQSRQKKQ